MWSWLALAGITVRRRSRLRPYALVAPDVALLPPALHNAISPIIASIFAGNSIVLKCSEQVAWSSRFYIDAIRSCIQACGFDPDIVQVRKPSSLAVILWL